MGESEHAGDEPADEAAAEAATLSGGEPDEADGDADGVDPRSQAVRALLASLPTIEPPIFPGPIPGRRAPRFDEGVWPQLEPLQPVADSGGRHGRAGATPAPRNKPRSRLLYGPTKKLRPPARRRRDGDDTPAFGIIGQHEPDPR